MIVQQHDLLYLATFGSMNFAFFFSLFRHVWQIVWEKVLAEKKNQKKPSQRANMALLR
jgi:hypothetical protein